MGLADYYHRDVVAVSQILQGFETNVFVEQLERIGVAVVFGKEAANSSDGRALLDLAVRLLARLYPSITFVFDPAAARLVEELKALAVSINPNIDVSRANDALTAGLVVGRDAPAANVSAVFVGCDGWSGRVGTKEPYSISNVGNPYGAGFAACLGVANLFRRFFLPNGEALLDTDISFPADVDAFPVITAATMVDPIVLAGVGAIGNAAAWALIRTPFDGEIHLVDHQAIELSNLQRYVLCGRSDEHQIKADTIANQFGGPLRAVPFHGTWASFLETKSYRWERVLVALDSIRDRRAVQGSLPRWIANGWTQTGDFGVSVHSFLGKDACLSCLYLPSETSKSEDQIVAEGLRIPKFLPQVRHLLDSGGGVDRALCESIAKGWGVGVERLKPFVGKPIRALWVDGICGGGIIPLGRAGLTPQELQVPLAFQSAFAGILLAAELSRDVLTGGSQRRTFTRQLDLLKPLADSSPRPRLKAGTGACICEDPDFVDAYYAKYPTTSLLTNA